jgi:hypothetical protein
MAPTSSLPLMVTSSEVVDGLDRASLLHAGGLPYSFDAFFLQGHSDTAAAPPAIEPLAPAHRRRQLQPRWDVMWFR